VELTTDTLEVAAVPLLDDTPVFEHVNEVMRRDLREVVSNDNGGSASPPAFDGLEYEHPRCRIEGRRGLIYVQKTLSVCILFSMCRETTYRE